MRNLPHLKSLVDDFISLETAEHIENMIFYLTLHGRSEVQGLEEFLSRFKVQAWEKKLLAEIKGRASGNSIENSVSVLMEGLTALHYAERLGVQNVALSPRVPSGEKADLKITVGNREMFVETTSLGTSRFDRAIDEVYRRLCRYLLSRLTANKWVDVRMNPVRLVSTGEENVDVQKVVSVLETFVLNLDLIRLFNKSKAPSFKISLERIGKLRDKEKTLFDHGKQEVFPRLHGRHDIPRMNILEMHDHDLAELIRHEPFRSWSMKITPSMVEGCPISYFIVAEHSEPIVHVGSWETSWGPEADLEKKVFLEQLRKKVGEKLEKHQRRRGSPNILIIRASHWLAHDYEGSDESAIIDFTELEKAVLEVIEDMRIRELSAVRLYERNYKMARTILNTHADTSSQLSSTELASL